MATGRKAVRGWTAGGYLRFFFAGFFLLAAGFFLLAAGLCRAGLCRAGLFVFPGERREPNMAS